MPFFFYLSDLHETEVWYQWNHGGSDFRNFESRKSKFLGNFETFWLKILIFLENFTRLTRNGAIFFWAVPGTCELVESVELSLLNKFDTCHIASWCIWNDLENPEYSEISNFHSYIKLFKIPQPRPKFAAIISKQIQFSACQASSVRFAWDRSMMSMKSWRIRF